MILIKFYEGGDEFSDKEINNSVGGILFKTIECKLEEEY